MQDLTRIYRLINILSLDIVAGAIVSALFFAKIFDVHILPCGVAALGLAVWIVYTADHLWDAKTIMGNASTSRHRFHQVHFKILIISLIVGLIVEAMIIFFIREQVFKWGMILGSGVGIYLLFQRHLKFLKEVFVALLYTAGVLLPSITITAIEPTRVHLGLTVQFAIIALINLLLFSWFDHDNDDKDDQHSFVTVLGKSFTSQCIWMLLTLNFIIGIITFMHPAAWILLLMNTLLLFIFILRTRVQHNDHYRLLGDAVFLTPVIYLLWHPR